MRDQRIQASPEPLRRTDTRNPPPPKRKSLTAARRRSAIQPASLDMRSYFAHNSHLLPRTWSAQIGSRLSDTSSRALLPFFIVISRYFSPLFQTLTSWRLGASYLSTGGGLAKLRQCGRILRKQSPPVRIKHPTSCWPLLRRVRMTRLKPRRIESGLISLSHHDARAARCKLCRRKGQCRAPTALECNISTPIHSRKIPDRRILDKSSGFRVKLFARSPG